MQQEHSRQHRGRKWLSTAVKVLIAVAGLWYVLAQVSWSDRVFIARGAKIRNVTFIRNTALPLLGRAGKLWRIGFQDQRITVRLPNGREVTAVANRSPIDFPRHLRLPANYLVQAHGQPEIEQGLGPILATAKLWPLAVALLLLGMPFVITAWRWARLMRVQGLPTSYGQCLTLTLVGQFYSTFLPGTTSGDVVKIIYAGRLTGQPTKSAVTVLLDRVIGLVGIMIVGGTAAAVQLLVNHFGATAAAPPDRVLLRVVFLITGLLAVLAAGATVYFSARLRRWFGVDALLDRLHLPEFIKHADRTLRVYRGHMGLLAVLLLASIVSQTALPVAGWLAGQAFGMRASFGCYLAYLPVTALATSLPIVPPQGLGVLDSLVLHFFVTRGVDSADQAFALAQVIRFFPIFWNLLGAYWVIRGHYGRPHVESLSELAPNAKEL